MTSVIGEAARTRQRAGTRRLPPLSGPRVAPWLFIAPFFVLLLAFTIVPAIYTVFMSVQSDRTSAFVGLTNYQTVLGDTDFRSALGVIWQAVYTLAPFFVVAATAIALLLDGKAGWGKDWIKLLIFLPYALPATVSTIIWAYNLSPDSSVFAAPLHAMGSSNLLFFARPGMLPYAIMNIVVWQNVGAWVVVLSAALAGLPAEVVEMARIEGAGAWALIWRIKLPLIAPVLVLMIVSVVSYVLTLITEPYLLQQALQVPPTFTPNMWAYNISFQSGAFSLAAAASLLMLLVSSIFAVVFVLRSGIYRLQDRD